MKYSILHLLGDDNFYETEYTVKVTNSFSGDQYEVKVKADNPDQAIIKIKDTFSERSNSTYEVMGHTSIRSGI